MYELQGGDSSNQFQKSAILHKCPICQQFRTPFLPDVQGQELPAFLAARRRPVFEWKSFPVSGCL